jgi:hypothetical protein
MVCCSLVEAAQTASGFDPGLGRDYQRLKFRRGMWGSHSGDRTEVGGATVLKAARSNSVSTAARMQGSPMRPIVDASPSKNCLRTLPPLDPAPGSQSYGYLVKAS